MTEYIQINPADNVAVALHPLSKGTIIEVNGNFIELAEDIPAGHKIALKDFAEGDMVIKYGFPISHTVKEVRKGHLLNEKTVKTNLSGLSTYTYTPKFEKQTFFRTRTVHSKDICVPTEKPAYVMRYGLSLRWVA